MTLSAKANAKINLNLRIIDKRQDGYHELETVMQSVDIADNLTFTATDGEILLECDNTALSNDCDIIIKAAKLFFKTTGISGGVAVKLQKNIPIAAGLGGGSSDAAATLLVLNKIYGMPLSASKLKELAVKLGADVPFFLTGGTAFCGGIGELIKKLEYIGNCRCLLIKCGIKSSTKDMYDFVDKNLCTDFNGENEKLPILSLNSYNSFNKAVDYRDAVDYALTTAESCGAFASGLSGSGPTVYALFKNESDISACEKILSKQYQTYICTTCEDAVIILNE
ncbi:MAG: 4-(cytidine 5'-diphospho)-2-C-methyl-D-erythritol kinase [Oscillospiraceae bacterium]|nr:4-(cytidine 5'-diphospho)-2-C-methyl-D-erythritol kinase [Candidatus Equicaccousia limihippi]